VHLVELAAQWQSDVRAERLQNFLFLAIQKGDNPFNSVKLFQCCFGAQSEKGLSPPCTSSEQAAHTAKKKIRETTTTTAGAERKKLGRKEKISKLFPT
jgi:hypothetical protein